jgi:hypothetical protein
LMKRRSSLSPGVTVRVHDQAEAGPWAHAAIF